MRDHFDGKWIYLCDGVTARAVADEATLPDRCDECLNHDTACGVATAQEEHVVGGRSHFG